MMKTWNDLVDFIMRKKPSVIVNLTLPVDFPMDNKYHSVSITMDELKFIGNKGRTEFFSGMLKLQKEDPK